MKALLLILITTLTYAGKLRIDSNPIGSNVYFISKKSNGTQAIGKTPFEIEIKSLGKYLSNNEALQIKVFKNGFKPFNAVVPILKNTEIDITANLEVETNIKYNQEYDLLVSDLFDVLRMIRLKDYSTAENKLSSLEKKFPHFSIVFEMKGTVYYLQKEFKKALNYFRKSFGINPTNREAYKMKVYLEKKFNIK